MPMIWRSLVIALAAVGGLSSVAVAGQIENVFDVPIDGKLILSVDGRSIEAFSGPGMPSILSLRRSVAISIFGANEEQGQKEGKAKSAKRFKLLSVSRTYDSKIGPTQVTGYGKKAELAVGPYATRAVTKWSEADTYDFADALAGPYAIPAPIVRYHLRQATGTEQTSSFPLLSANGWWVASTYMDVGGKRVMFAFAPQFATSVASAAAGAAISSELNGTLTGPPQNVLISNGIERPARTMRLNHPLKLGSLSIDRLLVRTTDYGSARTIKDEAIDPSEMADDIVVTGKRKSSRASYTVYIGADALQECSSITYDKARHLVHLMCE